jgi:hypothetical protein
MAVVCSKVRVSVQKSFKIDKPETGRARKKHFASQFHFFLSVLNVNEKNKTFSFENSWLKWYFLRIYKEKSIFAYIAELFTNLPYVWWIEAIKNPKQQMISKKC